MTGKPKRKLNTEIIAAIIAAVAVVLGALIGRYGMGESVECPPYAGLWRIDFGLNGKEIVSDIPVAMAFRADIQSYVGYTEPQTLSDQPAGFLNGIAISRLDLDSRSPSLELIAFRGGGSEKMKFVNLGVLQKPDGSVVVTGEIRKGPDSWTIELGKASD